MKFNLKMIAIATAMVSMAGAAHADMTGTSTNNGSLALTVFNTATNAWYIRNTGFFLNDFLPSSVTTLVNDGGVTGNKTPEAGLSLTKANTTSFADTAFGTWLSGQNTADIRWMLTSTDNVGTSTTLGVKRMIVSSADSATTGAFNSNIDNFVAAGSASGLSSLFGTGAELSKFDTTGAPAGFFTNFSFGANTLASLGQGASLFYFARSTGTGTTAGAANGGAFGNSLNKAVVTLATNGDFSYTLAPDAPAPVPVPAAAWLLGSGLMALGGAARRRKAAAKA